MPDPRPARPRPRLLLHIGTHKTGTSALQESLNSHRALLLQRGIHYPDTSRPPWPHLPKHCSTFHAAVSDDPALQADERDWLLAQARRPGVHTLLISEEGLSEPDERLPRFFQPLQAHLDIEVLCSLRRQDLFVEALYNQFTRERERREGRAPLVFARAASVRARLDYHALLSRWAAAGCRVHAADFEALRAGPGLMHWLGEAGGLDLSGLTERRINRSPDMRVALLLARWHRQRAEYDLSAVMRAAQDLAQQRPGERQQHVLGHAERERLLADLSPSNQQLATDFQVQFDAALPPQEPQYASEMPDPLYLAQLLARMSMRSA